jgi:hypothetical protein
VTGTESGHCPRCGFVPPRALAVDDRSRSTSPAIAIAITIIVVAVVVIALGARG